MDTFIKVQIDELKDVLTELKLDAVFSDKLPSLGPLNMNYVQNLIVNVREHCDIKNVKTDLKNGYNLLTTAFRNRESIETIKGIKKHQYDAEFGIVYNKLYTYSTVIERVRNVLGVKNRYPRHLANNVIDENKTSKFHSGGRISHYGKGIDILNNLAVPIPSTDDVPAMLFYKKERYYYHSTFCKLVTCKAFTKVYGRTYLYGIDITPGSFNNKLIYKTSLLEQIELSKKQRYIDITKVLPNEISNKDKKLLFSKLIELKNTDTVAFETGHVAKSDLFHMDKLLHELFNYHQ